MDDDGWGSCSSTASLRWKKRRNADIKSDRRKIVTVPRKPGRQKRSEAPRSGSSSMAIVRKPARRVHRAIRISGDCTGLESGVLSLRAIGLGSRAREGFASDINPHVRRYLQDNFEHTHVFSDVVTRDNRRLKKQLVQNDDIPDIYTAGWPCQPFSSAGLQQGVLDERGTVGAFVADTIKEIEPKSFILENVPAVLMSKHKPLLDYMLQTIGSAKARNLTHKTLVQVCRRNPFPGNLRKPCNAYVKSGGRLAGRCL